MSFELIKECARKQDEAGLKAILNQETSSYFRLKNHGASIHAVAYGYALAGKYDQAIKYIDKDWRVIFIIAQGLVAGGFVDLVTQLKNIRIQCSSKEFHSLELSDLVVSVLGQKIRQ